MRRRSIPPWQAHRRLGHLRRRPEIADDPAMDPTAQRPLTEAEREAARVRWCAAQQPSAPVRVGLLINPRAGRAQAARLRDRLVAGLPAPHAARLTSDLGSLRRDLAALMGPTGANVLAVAGGDGTVHHVVNALVALRRTLFGGEDVPMPRLLLLNGGTLNIVGRTCAIHGPPPDTLARFLRYFDGARLSRVPARRLSLLEVCWECDGVPTPPRLGFVFGSEVAYHAIELYERFGAGYGGLARFVAEVARGALTGGDLWRREGWKLGPYAVPVDVDGRVFATSTGVAASTVDLTLAIGAARSIRRQLYQPGFSVRLVEAATPIALVRRIPALMSDRGGAGIVDLPSAFSLRTAGPYTLDGELFHQPDVGVERVPLFVRLASERLQAVPGEWTTDEW